MPKDFKLNQSDDDKGAKKKSTSFFGDLNATHKREALKEQACHLSLKAQTAMQPVDSISREIDRDALEKLNAKFPSLIKETNILSEQVKKLSSIKLTDIRDRYKKAKKMLSYDVMTEAPLSSPLLRAFLEEILSREKKFFFKIEQALDNTYIIDAWLHEATLFKVGALYALYLHDVLTYRLIEMSIVLRQEDLPDRFKYIEQEGKLITANWIELAMQAHNEILSGDVDTLQRFKKSCDKLIQIYLGLNESKQVGLGKLDNEINFPEIPDVLGEERVPKLNTAPLKKKLPTYFCFNGDEFATLKFLIPEHKKNAVFISEIEGIRFNEFMRICLSRQIDLKKTQTEEMKQRTAAIQFLYKIQEPIHEAQRALLDDVTGKTFDPHHGYVSWSVEPKNIFARIQKLYADYQGKEIITEECVLSGLELTEKFFKRVYEKLNDSLEYQHLNQNEEYQKLKKNSSFFNKSKLKLEYEQKSSERNKKNQQRFSEMQHFQKIVNQVGAEHIKLHATLDSSKAGYSIPPI